MYSARLASIGSRFTVRLTTQNAATGRPSSRNTASFARTSRGRQASQFSIHAHDTKYERGAASSSSRQICSAGGAYGSSSSSCTTSTMTDDEPIASL